MEKATTDETSVDESSSGSTPSSSRAKRKSKRKSSKSKGDTPKLDTDESRLLKEEEARLEEERWKEARQKLPRVVDVKWLDFEHFKNVYNPSEGLEIIQVLRGHQRLPSEITRENRRRLHKKWDTRSTQSQFQSAITWPQRVRIQSPSIMLILSRLTGHFDQWSANEPHVFFRPFRTFYHLMPQIKKCLQMLEKRWGHAGIKGGFSGNGIPHTTVVDAGPKETKEPNTGTTPDMGYLSDAESEDEYAPRKDGNHINTEDAIAGELTDSVVSLQHLQKLVQFFEESILPDWEKAKTTTNRKVRFLDLWMYFLPDELLYAPSRGDVSRNSSQIYQTAWKCCSKALDPIKDEVPDDWFPNRGRQFDVFAYYIDYNGHSYGPCEVRHSINYYEGEKDITTLSIYPMRFVKDFQQMRTKLYNQGTMFQKVIMEKHLHYDGWTLTDGPVASSSELEAEHIDGDVIIDFVEGCKGNPSIETISFTYDSFEDVGWTIGEDCISTRYWADGPTSKLFGEIKDLMVQVELLTNFLMVRHKKQSTLLAKWEDTTITHLEGDDIALLPRRVIAYALRERKFVMVDIYSLRTITPQKNIFRDLKIDEEHKSIVMSLVKSHFKKQKLQKQQPGVGLNQDLIRGKGSGLFILLHGVPGVGKTATAEAVAQANKKPLFVITCGDLGFTPKEVEVSLGNIFRLAHLWNCVLLLDEADIFLTRREHNDLKRNALVSVFLRVLEYYSGILFLTTNRVGILDEAFKSRIHISMYYPPLSREYTIAIFDVNIRKLHAIEKEKRGLESEENQKNQKRPALVIDETSIKSYAAWHYDHRAPHQRWNGRQIRNSFQIAYSLADFDMQRSPKWEDDESESDDSAENDKEEKQTVSKLDYRQFQIVDKAIERFDRYLLGAMKGNTDTDYARLSGIRDDDHESDSRDHGPVYHSPRPRPPRQSQASRSHSSTQDYNGRASPGPARRQGGQRTEYKPSPPEYKPPETGTQSRTNRRLVPQEPRLGDNPRASPSRGPPRKTRPAGDSEYELGYSGWNTTKSGGRSSNVGYSNEEYNPDEGANSDGGAEYYDEYEDEQP